MEELERHAALVAALSEPRAYPHPVGRVERVETHISSVLLAGAFAYKLKKPLALDFLDFSTLEARRAACEAELRLNRRTAPDLYLDVVAVTGDLGAPRIAGSGAPIDWAVRMRRFPDGMLGSDLARRGALDTALVDALADRVAAFHRALPPAAADAPFGTPTVVHRWTHDNLAAVLGRPLAADERARVTMLADWTAESFDRHSHLFAARRHQGFVRECHGDLHLANVVLLDGQLIPFDCIEFNPALRWIDVMSEIAFTFMDLVDHALPRLAWRFVDRLCAVSGDYAGLATLDFYAVYRAMVRAKVALIRATTPGVDAATAGAAHAAFVRHLGLAERLAAPRAAPIVLMHGLSGSGKSTVAAILAETLGGVRLRSDVERKRLHGLEALDASGSAPNAGLYLAAGNERTYQRLAQLTETVRGAGIPVVIDAAFLRRDDRARFAALARDLGSRAVVVDCVAPTATLRERIARRAREGGDPSEATAAVLERQLASAEPLAPDEDPRVERLDTDGDPAAVQARAVELAARIVR